MGNYTTFSHRVNNQSHFFGNFRKISGEAPCFTNAADLPAVPFRTDAWPAKTQDAKKLVIDDMWR